MQNSHNKLRQGNLLSSHYWAEIWTVSINWRALLETIGYTEDSPRRNYNSRVWKGEVNIDHPFLFFILSATTSTKSILLLFFPLHVHMQLQILYVQGIYIKVCRIMTKEDYLCFQIWSMRCLELIIDESDGFFGIMFFPCYLQKIVNLLLHHLYILNVPVKLTL